MTYRVAESSRVDRRARVSKDAIMCPACVIGPVVEIGRGTELVSHVCLLGTVRIGEFNKIGPFVAIGGGPQDLSYWGSATRVEIGDFNERHGSVRRARFLDRRSLGEGGQPDLLRADSTSLFGPGRPGSPAAGQSDSDRIDRGSAA